MRFFAVEASFRLFEKSCPTVRPFICIVVYCFHPRCRFLRLFVFICSMLFKFPVYQSVSLQHSFHSCTTISYFSLPVRVRSPPCLQPFSRLQPLHPCLEFDPFPFEILASLEYPPFFHGRHAFIHDFERRNSRWFAIPRGDYQRQNAPHAHQMQPQTLHPGDDSRHHRQTRSHHHPQKEQHRPSRVQGTQGHQHRTR